MNPDYLLLGINTAKQMFLEDPIGFVRKVLEKFRSSSNRILNHGSKIGLKLLSMCPENEVEKAFNEGEFSKGIALADKKQPSRSVRVMVNQHKEKLIRLHHNFKPGVPIGSPKRVLHYLTNSLPYTNSGYTFRTHRVLESQRGAGLSVLGITRIGYPLVIGAMPEGSEDSIGGISYRRLLPPEFPSSLLQRDELAIQELVKEAKSFGAEAIQTTTDFTNAIVVSEAAAELGIPWVYEVRGELESTWASKREFDAVNSEFYKFAREAETRAMQAASWVVVLSDIYRQDAISRGVNESKITVVPNAIEDSQLDTVVSPDIVREKLELIGIPSHHKIIGTMTSVVSYEGLDTLIDALEFLPENVSVLIVGDGTEKSVLEERAQGKRVYFVGKKPQSEIMDWYALLDVFVIPRKDLPVTRKVTPIKGLQAQALGIPIVASDLPALREVTGGNEYYVRPSDPEDLGKGILEALHGGSKNGKDWARRRTWSANGERYKAIYRLQD